MSNEHEIVTWLEKTSGELNFNHWIVAGGTTKVREVDVQVDLALVVMVGSLTG